MQGAEHQWMIIYNQRSNDCILSHSHHKNSHRKSKARPKGFVFTNDPDSTCPWYYLSFSTA
jgi:hypothetical protein